MKKKLKFISVIALVLIVSTTYCSPELDALLDKYNNLSDEEFRKQVSDPNSSLGKDALNWYNNTITKNSSSNTPAPSQSTPKASTPKSTGPSIQNYSDNTHVFVITSRKAVYDSFKKGRTEIGSIEKGTEIVVTGVSSNGYYKFAYTKADGSTVDGYTYFKNKNNIVEKATYEAAWKATDRKEPTCTKDGSQKYVNTLSNKTRTDLVPKLGHDKGKWSTTKEATFFTNGKKELKCTRDNAVLKTKTLPSTLKKFGVKAYIALVAIVVLIVSGITLIVVKKKSKTKENTPETE